jgi:acetyl-CoA C-acetyltransferase
MVAAMDGVVNKFNLKGQTLGEVALGAVIKHSSDWSLARECVIDSGLSLRTPAVDMQRACGTSLEAAIMIANKVALGQIEAGIAGGTDTVSDAPVVYPDAYRRLLMEIHRAQSPMQRIASFFKIRPGHFKPVFPGVKDPRTGLSMGESTKLRPLMMPAGMKIWLSPFRMPRKTTIFGATRRSKSSRC